MVYVRRLHSSGINRNRMFGKIVSLNIGANATDFGGLMDVLKTERPMLVFLQESVGAEELQHLVEGLNYSVAVSMDPGMGRGVAVIWKNHLEVKVRQVEVGRVQVT